MLKTVSKLILVALLSSCNTNSAQKAEGPLKKEGIKTSNYEYSSDYFVFVADDTNSPLVIPIDNDWYPSGNGYTSEFKSWYGTNSDWPIAYHKNEVKKATLLPQEVWNYKKEGFIEYDKTSRTITTNISGAPKVKLMIPAESEWVVMPTESTLKKMYGFKTTAIVKGETKTGWAIYERIRWDKKAAENFESFEDFFWIPLVINGDFFHFEQHKGEQTAVKWSIKTGQLTSEIIPNYTFNILNTISDAKSKRKNIPNEIQIIAPKWNVDISLKSGGSQVGYGGEFPKGLAYYRQSLLQATPNSKTKGYGMMELVLENN